MLLTRFVLLTASDSLCQHTLRRACALEAASNRERVGSCPALLLALEIVGLPLRKGRLDHSTTLPVDPGRKALLSTRLGQNTLTGGLPSGLSLFEVRKGLANGSPCWGVWG